MLRQMRRKARKAREREIMGIFFERFPGGEVTSGAGVGVGVENRPLGAANGGCARATATGMGAMGGYFSRC